MGVIDEIKAIDFENGDIYNYSQDELLSLAKAGLKLAKQNQRRLVETGYELGSYIGTFNKRMSVKRLDNDTLGQLRDDMQYMQNYFNSLNTSVKGRIQKGRDVLNSLGIKEWDKNYDKDALRFYPTKGNRRFKIKHYGEEEIISEDELKEFFKLARELEDATTWNSKDKTTDYSVLQIIFQSSFSRFTDKPHRTFKELKTAIEDKLAEIRGEDIDIPDSFESTRDDEVMG